MFCFLLCFFLVACTSLAGAPRRLELVVDVAADANPNIRGRPSPVVLNVLQLTNAHRLIAADYLALLRDPDTVLQQTLTSAQKTRPIAPGDSMVMKIDIEKDVRYLGFVVELAQFGDAHNRTVVPIDTVQKNGHLRIAINHTGVQSVPDQTATKHVSRFNED